LNRVSLTARACAAAALLATALLLPDGARDVPAITAVSAVRGAEQLVVYLFDHDWCELFHAGAILHMCTDAEEGSCTIVRDGPTVSRLRDAKLRGTGDTFAIPVVALGDLMVSQSVAATVMAGERLGFAAGVVSGPKALQYMLDMKDLLDEAGLSSYRREWDEAAFGAFVAPGGRLDLYLGLLERAIAGPFFFPGSTPTYVDYYLATTLAWMGHRRTVQGKGDFPGQEHLQNYSKVRGVLSRLAR